jgi:hypothetical protein
MIFIWILCGLIVCIGAWALLQWWRDEQEKLGKVVRHPARERVIPSVASFATPLHPSIDPYLAELRDYLLQEPLPQGPGEMANRVYTHLNQWITIHANDGYSHEDEFEFHEVPGEEQKPEPRFINMSRNDPVPPPGYLEHIMDKTNDNQ